MTKISNCGLAYEDTELGNEVLLFVHGIMMSKAVWKEQVAYFSPNFRVVTVDLYGFGDSTGDFRESSYEDHARDLRKLLDELQIPQATLVGWSLGGAVAMAFAGAYPETLKRLLLVDSTPKLISSNDFLCAIDPNAASGLLDLLESDRDAGCSAFVDMQIPEDNCEKQRSFLMNLVQKTNTKVALTHFQTSSRRDLRGVLQGLRVPTLIVCGELDGVCPPGASEFMKNQIKGAELCIMKGLGHAPFLTDPDAFNSIVKHFLDP